jgi:hypothetical protein
MEEQKEIKNDGGKGYTCICGVYHKFDMYVYAHPRDILVYTCDCGHKVKVIMMHAASARRRKAADSPKKSDTQDDQSPNKTK